MAKPTKLKHSFDIELNSTKISIKIVDSNVEWRVTGNKEFVWDELTWNNVRRMMATVFESIEIQRK